MKVFRKTHPLDTIRRKSVIGRLEAQLKSGDKTPKGSFGAFKEPLTESDKIRINKELVTLKSRT